MMSLQQRFPNLIPWMNTRRISRQKTAGEKSRRQLLLRMRTV